jgi:hypothetical protein
MVNCAIVLTDKHEIKFYDIFQNPNTFEIKEPHLFVGFIVDGRPINIDLHALYFEQLKEDKSFLLKSIEIILMSKQTFPIFIPSNLYRDANTMYNFYIDTALINVFRSP